ncbi:ABC transporter membrane spanning protein (Sugar) [uncultured Pleomorphomonas sp.]|uniref:ABC transporter membrane spanning protein (Sugar) n=1 Tax=uncultured Pleomorphomonas sp. TaxID=442121 RepID=A0A212LMR8_9HYPH|nr:sugar ABC transporter permease [uncultured Pleomorphomonas sp.]SCM78817.1 ABC transporter membrane spanning protein (Sugar) [uncultured Pleomorphomonas sp.]
MTDVTLSPGKAAATVKRPTGASIGPRWSNALFVAPYLAFYLALLVYPLFKGIWMSMLQSDMFDDTSEFAGLANYYRLFNDKVFIGAVWNTVLFVVMTVPAFTVIGLLLALALNRSDRTAATLRAIFFGNSVLSVAIVAIIWQMMYMPDNGAINGVLKFFGLQPIAFINSASLALVAIAICTVWWIIGLPMMLFLAALQQIPGELYEAAALDNASRWRSFWSITLPSIRRTMLVVVIYEIVAQFQLFGQAWLLTRGGPNNASRPIVLFIYEQGFRTWNLGYAAAASEVLFVIMAVAALAQFFASRKRVEG